MILSRENLSLISKENIIVPHDNDFELPEKVLQFGTGVLLRGLPDYFINKANQQGIFNGRVVVVKSTGSTTTEFDEQDSLYTLCVRGIENGQLVAENIISSAISRVIAANTNWGSILEIAESTALQVIISNTTEIGIQLVNESINQNPPVSFPAKVLAILHRRYQTFKGAASAGLVIVATELIPDNGTKLGEIVTALARYNQLDADFMTWLHTHNQFCNSLVDRIVPGKPDSKTLASLQNDLGYTDNLLSICEPYRLWAIEGDEKVAEALSFAKADDGVIIAEDIEVYRELKVRLLNGTHTLSAAIAILSGIDTVKNAMDNEQLKAYIDSLMLSEIGPAIPYQIAKERTLAFTNSVRDRFANPAIAHSWINITFQYSMKMKIRILPLLLNYFKLFNSVPEYFALGFAAYLRFMKIEYKEDSRYFGAYHKIKYLITDDSAGYFYEKLAADPSNYPATVLNDTEFWGTDLKLLNGWIKAVQEKYDTIENDGIIAGLTELTTAKLDLI